MSDNATPVRGGSCGNGTWLPVEVPGRSRGAQPPRESERATGIKGIERSILWNGRAGGTTWFHPRACMIPAAGGPVAFMTLQSITGSDVFGHVQGRAKGQRAGVKAVLGKAIFVGLLIDRVERAHTGVGTVE